MSNLSVKPSIPSIPVNTTVATKTEKPVLVQQAESNSSNKDQVELSARGVGKVAAVSVLGGGAVAGLGALALHSASKTTGMAAVGVGLLGAALVGTGIIVGVGGGIGGTLGAAFANSKPSGAALGATVSGAIAGGIAFAITKDPKMALYAATPAALVGGAGGYWGAPK